ncbi:chemotaxis protein CheB [Phycisphaerales bacterium AB-hyl4]|uniref:protein-glutamate O-methyltransferase n=1 Tax=Natronomicrosphaera hydrolytica TaxID=3242702 RepID=A0ABV4U572_9BACT
MSMSAAEERPRRTEPEPSRRPDEGAVDPSQPSPAMRVVGIGASAGGLTALKQLFATMPEQPGACFVVVVHLAADHESHLAPLLQANSRIPVQQITGDTSLEANHVYVIPPGANIDVIDTHLRLSDLEPKRLERAPIDHFFRSLAEAHQEQAVGVVLTGTGSDGTAGLRRIRERGGLTIVQSPDEAEHDAMPRSAIAAGVADLILPLEEILAHILHIGQASPQVPMSDDDPLLAEQAERMLQNVLAHVRTHTGHDFAHYKRSTILRRIRRRMQLHRVQHLDDYLRLLQEQEQEMGLLFEDLLITVTEFFRDPEVFARLEAEVIPQLFKDKGPADRVRAWSVGCATGEEAYSLAMLLMEEEARREVKPRQLQVFASDLCEPALRKAREGIYPDSIEGDVSSERLSRFFDKENSSYRIHKNVRERLVFATHNILQDPPFSHLQLICCRNVLIYLQRDAQKHLTSLFHYALDEDGYLLLGTAEAIDTDLFICENKKFGLYRRRSVPAHKPSPSIFQPSQSHTLSGQAPPPQAKPATSYGAMHERVVEQYAPPSILINPDGEVVHYSARAGRYMQMPGGPPTNNVYRLVPEPLRLELRAAVHAARDLEAGHRSRPVTLSIASELREVVLRVQPIDQSQMAGFFLVIFDELENAGALAAEASNTPADANARELASELDQTKQRMQALVEEHDASQERLQAYNEELVSTNEELRSTMEELETSKEEMQSMNEELTTLNEENRQKVEELDHLTSDLHNLLTATNIATVFLDREMRIRRFTPSMAELFSMRNSDRGRSLTDLTHHLSYDQLQEDFQSVLDQLTPVERELATEQGRWYLTRLQCYRTSDDRIEGVVITFIDITERKQIEEAIDKAKHVAEEVINTVRNPMLVLGKNLRVKDTNAAFDQMFAVESDELQGQLVYEINEGHWDIPELRQLLENILPKNEVMDDYELEHDFPGLGPRTLLLNARRIDHLQLILLAIEDVTERKQELQALERSRDELERLVNERTVQLRLQTTRLQHLVRELATAEQRERKRMASILHDDLQQLLVGMKMQLGLTRSQNQDEAVAQTLEQVLHHLDEAIETTRSLVRQVVPQALYEKGLTPALQWLSEQMSHRHSLKVQISADDAEPALSNETRTLLFESIREMLFNVVKHAGVDEAAVTVRPDHDRLHVTVSDEGVGFDVNAKTLQAGRSDFGVFALGDRIEALGGDWSVDSAPGEGTRVHVEVPVAATTEDPAAQAVQSPGRPPTDGAEPAEGVIRVLVVDDHVLVRNGIVTILHQTSRVTVVGEANDGVEAIAAVEQLQPDVVLMDVNMPHMNGFEATREIHRRWPNILVIGLSMQSEGGEAARAMADAGAATCLSKSDDAERMIDTILRLTLLS